MGPPHFFRWRRPTAEPVIDVATPVTQRAYLDTLEEKERAVQASRPLVDFSQPPQPPPIRHRGSGDPPPTFRIVSKRPATPRPKPAVLPDVVD